MSRTLSPSSGRPYGLARVCRVWRAARPLNHRVSQRVRAATPSTVAQSQTTPVSIQPASVIRRPTSTSAPRPSTFRTARVPLP